ncbi:MAG TPA: hypothetical protein VK564_00690 [Thermodesulfobacteriota bacterium]|nr:hypothetical protein [Thermodesulfobacteriota bacterium]
MKKALSGGEYNWAKYLSQGQTKSKGFEPGGLFLQNTSHYESPASEEGEGKHGEVSNLRILEIFFGPGQVFRLCPDSLLISP